MEAENFEHALETFKGKRPFRPFTVALENGDRFEVDHPNALAFQDGVTLYSAPEECRSSSTMRPSARSW